MSAPPETSDAASEPEPKLPEATIGPEGSSYDAAHRRRSSKSLWRRIRGWISWQGVGLVALVFPYVYYVYCWVIWKTSRHHNQLNARIQAALDQHVGVVSLMWHEEVFPSAFAYGPLRGNALASTSNFGRIITRMLEVCGCEVYRGGSSGGSRRRRVLPDMIRYMSEAPHCLYGLTVDGSRGPAYELKSGGLVIARACNTPIYLVRTWFSHHIRLRTWDRTAVPLPFGKLYQNVIGPFWVPPDMSDEELLVMRKHLELELLELAEHSLRHSEPKGTPPRRREGFPEDWTPRWAEGHIGLPYGPHDLKPDDPPPWAKRQPGAAPPA